ncbi:MAG: DNA adenine methylase, partial [Clostridiales bacterium]|nr:DNA adenine methylase [Clostridiales bacterium]
MVRKGFKADPIEIDFKAGCTVSSFDSKLTYIQKKLYAFRNPYIGNKRKLASNIIKTIDSYGIKYDSVLDLFCGSSSMSMAFKILGKSVYCNDIMQSCYMNALAFILNGEVTLTEDEKKFLLSNVPDIEIDPFFSDYEDRFTKNEIRFLNNYHYNIGELFSPFLSDGLTRIKSALCFAYIQNYIMEHCFVGGRLNNGQVIAKLEHRMNHARNKNRNTNEGMEMSFNDIQWNNPIPDTKGANYNVFGLDAIYLLENLEKFDISPDLCYIDPPYGGDQSDYSSMFDFIEGYINFQKKEDRSDSKARQKFINSKSYSNNFKELMRATVQIPWMVVSYNNSSWGNIDEIS